MTPEKDERWERVIESILSKSVSHVHVGIYGIVYCQVCGRLGTYDGWCVAKLLHANVNGKSEFVCGKCVYDSPARTGANSYDGGKVFDFAREVLGARPYRYCDICGVRTEIALQEKYDVKIWACAACKPKLSDEGFYFRVQRRRYVESKCTTYEQLCVFDIKLEMEKLEMEDTLKPELRSQRSARTRAALQKLERIHGESYVELLPDEKLER